jgi:uncharacterized protein
MQPTTLCNLNCAYCYLPHRKADRRMPVAVAEAVARSVNPWAAAADRFSLVWHGGEPLTAGRAHLGALMAPFEGVEQHVQTNATLIDDDWCAFFREHDVRVGLSVDGPAARTSLRVDWAGHPAFERIMRGVAALRRHDIRFAAICVVADPKPGLARELYEFFVDLGCFWLGINIEEREGVNTRSNRRAARDVQTFWAELAAAWLADPAIELREIEWALRYAGGVLAGDADELLPRRRDPIPTVASDGRVVLFSPELAGFTHEHYGDFASGNVLERPLHEIVAETVAAQTGWIAEYLAGTERCREQCPYFGFCGGGQASNRLAELGRFDATTTDHCRDTKIRLLEGVMDHAAAL